MDSEQGAVWAPLPSFGGEVVARGVCRDAAEGYFSSLAARPGFHRALLATIEDFKQACLAPADLERAVARLPARGRWLADKLRDLHALWDACERRLAELKLYDEADLLAAAADAAPDDPWLGQAAAVMVYGFYDLNPLQRRLVASCRPGLAFFPYEPGAEAFRYAAATFEWFLAQGFEACAEPEPDLPRELAALRRNLFGVSPFRAKSDRRMGVPLTPEGVDSEPGPVRSRTLQGAVDSQPGAPLTPEGVDSKQLARSFTLQGEMDSQPGAPLTPEGVDSKQDAPGSQGLLRIVSAPDEAREVKAVIRAALAAGRPLHRVGILLRQAGTYAPLFAEECEAGGLAAYHHDPPPVSTTRAGRSLLMLLRLLGSDLARADVMDFVTYADIPFEQFVPSAAAQPAEWDLLTMDAGVVKGLDNWLARLGSYCCRLKAEAEEDIAGQRRPAHSGDAPPTAERVASLEGLVAFVEAFFKSLDAVPREGTWAELVEAVLGVFRRFVRGTEERREAEEAVAGLAALDATRERADLAMLARVAAEALQGRRPQRPPFGSCGPVVADLMQARGLPFDVVCVPGLVEKSFPAAPSVDPLLSDRERGLLARAGLSLPLKRERALEERLLFRLAVGAGAERVILTYPRLDPASGRERVPSHFLLRAAEAVTGRRQDYRTLEAFAGHERLSGLAFAPPEPADAWRDAEYDLAVVQAAVAAGRGEEVLYLAGLSPTFGSAVRAERSRWGERRFTEYDGLLRSEAALAALAKRLGDMPWVLSATALERYASCPFRYFLENVLGAVPLQEPEEVRRLSGLDRGSLLHRILSQALARARRDGRLPLRADYEEEMLEVAREGFRDFEREGLTGYPALWELERDGLELELRRFVLDEAGDAEGYVPAHFEVCFGLRPHHGEGELGSEEGVLFDLGEGRSVRLRGRIDRIDLRDGQARVLDYKTGSTAGAPKADSFAGGTALQLPLYLRAAQRLLGERATVELAAYRYVTARGGYKTIGFSRAASEERAEELQAILATIATGIAEGRFFAGLAEGACRGCDYASVCGAAAQATARLKAADEAARPYLAMREIP